MSAMERIYLDYAATTPLDPRVRRAMEPYFTEQFGNPGSIHAFGQEAMAAVDGARETIAEAIGADFREIVFIGSATEANNLVLRGLTRTDRGLTRTMRVNPRPRLIVSAIEHESVLETARDLERDGVEVVVLPVSREGIVDLDAFRKSLNERTALVSVMYANNEIGTIQPIAEIGRIVREFRDGVGVGAAGMGVVRGWRQKRSFPRTPPPHHASSHTPTPYPLFHTDAVQAFQYLDCTVEAVGVDLMTLSSHKIYGPKGIGALYVRHKTRDRRHGTREKGQVFSRAMSHVPCPMSPIITGGGQEFGLRSGTENVPAIVGFAKAVELALRLRLREAARVTKLRDRLLSEIRKRLPALVVNGSEARRLPNNLNIRIPGVRAEELVTALDLKGFAVSAGPACAARASKSSHALRAIGLSDREARECLRITLGRPTTALEIDRFIKGFVQCMQTANKRGHDPSTPLGVNAD